jgi:hypothetical protein
VLSPEQAERVATQQAALAQDISMVQEWVDAHPTDAGGFWLDNSAAEAGTGKATMVLALATAVQPPSALLDGLGNLEQLRVVQVRHSQARLREVAEAVVDRRMPGVSGVDIDVVHNRVRVCAATGDDEALLNELASRYEPDVLNVRPGVVVVHKR